MKMPARDSLDNSEAVSAKVIADSISSCRMLLLDCRTQSDFAEAHIRGAISLTLPASLIMLRRLANGKLNVSSLVKNPDAKELLEQNYKTTTLVLYDSEAKGNSQVSDTLLQRLRDDGCDVVFLQGGFENFQSQYPEWCESESSEETLLGLMALRISSVSPDSGHQEVDSGLGDCTVGSPPVPVEILPHLYLGNASDSRDWKALEKYRIHYVLNVTPNLPNAFENAGMDIKYMQIPIRDHWSQNLSSFFPQAIDFIDEARKKKLGVLVHCLAGISRSVTITLAYLMHELNISLNEAYDFVQQRKANIAPNLNFLSQLKDYEQELNITSCHSPKYSFLYDSLTLPNKSPDSAAHTEMWS